MNNWATRNFKYRSHNDSKNLYVTDYNNIISQKKTVREMYAER